MKSSKRNKSLLKIYIVVLSVSCLRIHQLLRIPEHIFEFTIYNFSSRETAVYVT